MLCEVRRKLRFQFVLEGFLCFFRRQLGHAFQRRSVLCLRVLQFSAEQGDFLLVFRENVALAFDLFHLLIEVLFFFFGSCLVFLQLRFQFVGTQASVRQNFLGRGFGFYFRSFDLTARFGEVCL